ncbi:cytochrome P450 family protein [Allostreptomyces psammosilenae]|uniref:Cytochrome P450 n=1 Tax=Allostreptomyces psammosilenae TaxID=1892865 RepID=A0A853A0P3_9ACTN|nr:cytochrome P450 [Allostreptomyces psammosilenae]NYI07707.1 hypothetical protein [Allostreptomyces psammosilenae]
MATTPHTPAGADADGVLDLMSPELLTDPFGGYSRIREQTPVTRASAVPGTDPAWIVTRYDDVKFVLGDPRFVNNPASVPGMEVPSLTEQALVARGVPPEYMPYLLTSILSVDGADHARLRRLVSRAFTARRVAELRPRVEEITEDLLTRLPEAAEDGVVDLLRHFAYPLPIVVICELVGIPEEDRPLWRDWSEALTFASGQRMADTMRDLVAYTHALIERRRAEPTGDLVSALVRVHDEDGDRLSDTEMVMLILALVIAGHETTAHLIGNGTAALLTHPDQLAALRDDPGLAPSAVHELMRWCGTAQMASTRYATEDVEISGTLVRKGEAVFPVLVAANYDPRRFDDPEPLDITRPTDGRREIHVGFGHGLHYCLGAALARQEGEVAFTALLRRYPNLALGVPAEELTHDPVPGSWRLSALPVRL